MVIDSTASELDWECFLIDVGVLVEKRFTTGYVKCTAEDMGWRHLSGYKVFKCDTNDSYEDIGRRFVNSFCPNCDWSADVYSLNNSRGLFFRVTHHDNPVNGDKYYLMPISERTYNQLL